MSEYAGEVFVKVIGDTREFTSDLDKKISQQAPSVQGTLARTGLDKELRSSAALRAQAVTETEALVVAEAAEADSAARAATAHENLAVHTHRASIAGLALRSSTVGLGIGVLAAAEGAKELSTQLRVTGEEATTGVGRLRNFSSSLLGGDIVGGLKALTAGFALSAESIQDFEAALAKGDTTKLNQLVIAANALGDSGLLKQVSAAQAQVRASRIADTGTAASITPGLQDDLEAARTVEREARIGVRVLQQGTAQYSKAFAGYAEAIKARRAVQEQIAKQSVPADTTRDARFQLNLLRAQQTESTANDRAILAGRKTYLQNQVKNLEEQGANTAAAKTRLTTLYGQLESVSGQLVALDKQAQEALAAKVAERFAIASTNIQIQAANARNDTQEIAARQADAALNRQTATQKGLDKQTQLGYLLQAAQDDKEIFGIRQAAAAAAEAAAEAKKREAEQEKKRLEAERKAALEKAAAARATVRQTKELRLDNAIAAAALTKTTVDDKATIGIAINYYKNLVRTTRGLQQEQNRAKVIGLRGQLKGLGSNDSNAPRSSASDFFNEAASQFRSFGSNISTSGGILSGQDSRAAFAARALSSNGIQAARTAQAQQTRNAALVEAQKQTALLTTIAGRLTFSGAERDPPAKGIANARRGAHVVQAAV